MSVDVPKTFGALLIGGLFASVLSGVVIVQTVLYYKMYASDPTQIKALVFAIWLLDSCHSGCIWAAIWNYLIDHYGNSARIDFIPWDIALTIVFTAILTFLVHCFFAHRIFMLSKRNWHMTYPILILAVLRLVSASVTTGAMIHYHSFSGFKAHFRWVFTLGLALSSTVDILITGSLFFLLQTSRVEAGHLNRVIDSLILYAFETGSLTCAATIISMICWIMIPQNLIFMGLHFVIGKLYANSLLVTLNTRQNLRRSRSSVRDGPVLYLDTRRQPESDPYMQSDSSKITTLQINVERSVQYEVESRDPVTFGREA